MAALQLNYGEFRTVPEGEVILKIKEVKCTPKAKPTKVIIDFVDNQGATLQEKYQLTNKTAIFALTMVLNKAAGVTKPSIDVDEIPGILTGKFLLAEVKHTVKDKVKDGVKVEGEKVTFANLKKCLGSAQGFVATEEEEEAVTASTDLDDDNLDLDDELNLDDDELDLED